MYFPSGSCFSFKSENTPPDLRRLYKWPDVWCGEFSESRCDNSTIFSFCRAASFYLWSCFLCSSKLLSRQAQLAPSDRRRLPLAERGRRRCVCGRLYKVMRSCFNLNLRCKASGRTCLTCISKINSLIFVNENSLSKTELKKMNMKNNPIKIKFNPQAIKMM